MEHQNCKASLIYKLLLCFEMCSEIGDMCSSVWLLWLLEATRGEALFGVEMRVESCPCWLQIGSWRLCNMPCLRRSAGSGGRALLRMSRSVWASLEKKHMPARLGLSARSTCPVEGLTATGQQCIARAETCCGPGRMRRRCFARDAT